MKINGNLKFDVLGSGELQNTVIENVAGGATGGSLPNSTVSGHIVYNTNSNTYWFHNGTAWNELATGGNTATLQTEIDAIETASGGIFDTDGTYVAATLDALTNVTGSTSLANALSQLDAAISGANELAELTDVTLTSLATGDVLIYDGVSDWENKAIGSASGIQAYDANLDQIAALAPTADSFVVGNGAAWTVEDNTSARTSLGLDAGGAGDIWVEKQGDTMVGDLTISTADLIITGAGSQIRAVDGTAAIPTYSFGSDTDTGIFLSSTGQIGFVSGGTEFLYTKTNGVVSSTIAGYENNVVADGDLTNKKYVDDAITVGAALELNDLTDVIDGTAQAAGSYVFVGNGTNMTVTSATLGVLDNVAAGVDSATTDDVFGFDGTNWTAISPATFAGDIAIGDISDVTITAAAANEFLVFDGTAWVDTTAADSRTAMDVYSKGESVSKFLDVAGDTMTGDIAMGGSQVTGLGTPTNADDAATKAYADALVAGLTWKNSVVVSSTANIDLTNGTLLTIDGITVVAGDRVLVKDQTAAAENGIYEAASGAWARASDLDSISPIDEVNSAAVFVEQGTAGADTGWTVTSTVATLGSDDIDWTQFTGASGVTAGLGLVKTGNVLDINFGAGIAQLPSDEVGVDLYLGGGLRLSDTLDGAASTATGAKLQILRDGTTLVSSSNGIKVASGGITEVELNASVAGTGLTGGAGSALSIATSGVVGTMLDTAIAGAGLDLTGGVMSVSVESGVLETTGDEVGIVDGGVANVKLTNSDITMAADSGTADAVALGETFTVAGGTLATTTVTANTITVDVAASTSDLGDVTAAASVAGEMMVSDGTNYAPKQVQYVKTIAGATSTWTITHNLNQKYVNVTVYDSSDEVIIPQTITATSTSVTTITFNTAITGTAVVMGISGLAAV